MEKITLQVIALIFSLFALSRVFLRFKEKKLSSFAFLFWNFIWMIGLVVIFFPEVSSKAAKMLGIGRGVDVILYSSIIALFYLIFRLYIKIEDTQRQITEIIRKIALKNIPLKNKKSKMQ